jgi:hypothetical protein
VEEAGHTIAELPTGVGYTVKTVLHFRKVLLSPSDNLPQARKKSSVMLHGSPRLIKYKSMELSALGGPQAVAKGLHSSSLGGAVASMQEASH